MRNTKLILSISLALSLSNACAVSGAWATQLNAPPLPHERDLKDFKEGDDSEYVVPPTATRFSRRHDYRQDDKQKAEDAAQAKKDAADNIRKAQDQQIDAYKKQIQTAVDANNSAVALGKQGRWEEAIVEHEKAVQYDSRNKQFRINLSAARTTYGQLCMSKGSLSQASSLFRKALAAAPDNGLAREMPHSMP